MKSLFFEAFIDRKNLDPDAFIRRLWHRSELYPDIEKLLVS